MMKVALDETTDYDRLLQIFHLWASLFGFFPLGQRSENVATTPVFVDFQIGLEVEYSRWDMWMAYYLTLSEILKQGLYYSSSYKDSHPHIVLSWKDFSSEELLSARLRQRTELKNVESMIETKLLEEMSFPKANDRNERVERWVDAVMDNWQVMCGHSWKDVELGEGGKNAISRGVLDVS